MVPPQGKAKASLLKSAAAKPAAAPRAQPLVAQPAAKGDKKQLTLKERQQQQQALREKLLQQQQQGKAFTAPKLKTKFVSRVKQPVAALDAPKKPAAAAAKPAAAAPAAAAAPPAAAPKPLAAAEGKAAAPPARADGKQPPAAAAKSSAGSAAAAAKAPLAAAAKPPLAAAGKVAAVPPPLVKPVGAAQPQASGAPVQPPKPPLPAKGAPGAPLLPKEAPKPPILPKRPPGGAALQPKETAKPKLLLKGPLGAPLVPKEAPKPAILPKEPPWGASAQPKEAPRPAILPKGSPKPPLPPEEAPKIAPKIAPKPAVEAGGPKAGAGEDAKKAVAKEPASVPAAAGKAAAAAAGKAGTATAAAGKAGTATAAAKLGGKGPAPKKSLAELLGGDKRGPAPKKTLAELLGGTAAASAREGAPSGGPSSAGKDAASDKQQAATAEAAAAAAAIAAFGAAHPEEFAAALAPVAHLKVELIKKISEQNPQIPEAALAAALKKLPGVDAGFASLRIFLGQRWGQERVRLLESAAGKRALGGPSKDGEQGAPTEPVKVGALRASLFKTEASKENAEGGGAKKVGAGGHPKKEEEGRPPKKEGAEGPPKKAAGGPLNKEGDGPLTAEALARRTLVAMPKICEAKAWQEAAEVYAAECMRAASAVVTDWKQNRGAAFAEVTGKAVAERELARLKQQQQQQQQQQKQGEEDATIESWLTLFPTGLPPDLKADLEKRKPNYPEKAVLLLQDAIDVERLQVLLPVLVESNRYLALLLRTAEKQRELQTRAAEKQQQQKEEPLKKARAAAAAAKETRPGFLKREVPAFLAKAANSGKVPLKPKEEAGASQLQLFAAEASLSLPAFPQYLIVGAAKKLSAAALPPVECPLLSILLRKEQGHFVHLLLVQRLLLQLPGLELLHLALSCSACNAAVDVCLRKTLAGLPFQAEDAFSDIEYWFNAIRFFFQAACQVLPINRLRDHRGAALALKTARETFPVTADGMEALVCITLDRLSPLSIAACDFTAPMRHRADREHPAGARSKATTTDITLGDFVAEYRKRARIKGDALASAWCSAACDEDLASLLLLKLLQCLTKAVERHRGSVHFRRIEFLSALGYALEHRLWIQMELYWAGSSTHHAQQRSLFFTLADHFRWVA
ncbi:hypothetical protein Esti_002936 [Eimeria stiedai]